LIFAVAEASEVPALMTEAAPDVGKDAVDGWKG